MLRHQLVAAPPIKGGASGVLYYSSTRSSMNYEVKSACMMYSN